ncbi:hypothetical protein BHE74_00042945 [Ensete ventricosum]|nr:hypothetical protein BHE74_00042945 [Ensete ventricosum]
MLGRSSVEAAASSDGRTRRQPHQAAAASSGGRTRRQPHAAEAAQAATSHDTGGSTRRQPHAAEAVQAAAPHASDRVPTVGGCTGRSRALVAAQAAALHRPQPRVDDSNKRKRS